jgi:hypothetical protein
VAINVIKRAIATLSWIDPRTGLPEVDKAGDPGPTINRALITGRAAYRFSSFLNVTARSLDGRILDYHVEPDSGMYRSPSFLGIPSAPVGNIGQYAVSMGSAVVFRQLVGCRTVSPETIGGTVGGILGGPIGQRLGKEAAEYVSAFPPIWTEIEMTIYADGNWTHQLIQHSLFPSVSYYAINAAGLFERQGRSYDAVPNLERWKQKGWGPMLPGKGGPTPGNPWRMTSPKGWGGSTTTNIPESNAAPTPAH